MIEVNCDPDNLFVDTPVSSKDTTVPTGANVIFVVDTSGSMSGRPLQDVKNSLTSYLRSLPDVSNTTFNLVEFNSMASVKKNLTKDSMIANVSRLYATGMTNFKDALRQVEYVVKYQPDKYQVIVFLTDGQDSTRGGYYLSESINSLTKTLENCKGYSFYTLGYGSSHDAKFLDTLNPNGVFRYIRQPSDMTDFMDSVDVSSNFLDLTVGVYSGDTHVADVSLLPPTEDMPTYSGITKLSASLESPLEFKYKDKNLDVTFTESTNPLQRLRMSTSTITQLIRELTRSASNSSSIPSREYELVLKLRKRIEELKPDIKKISYSDRQEMYAYLDDVYPLIEKFFTVFKSATARATLHNTDLAELMSLSNTGTIRRSLKNRVAMRAGGNSLTFATDEKRINDIVKDYTPRTPVDPDLTCYLCMETPEELVSHGAALGRCCLVKRPCDGTVVAPELLHVQQVYNSCMCTECFVRAILYKGSTSSLGDYGNLRSNGIIQGPAREEINCIAPMYLFAEHFEVAVRRMKPIYGVVSSLDPQGYAAVQSYVIPFLMIHQLRTQEFGTPTEWGANALPHMEEFGRALMGDRFKKNLNDSLAKFMEDPLSRTRDVIPSLSVWTTQLSLIETEDFDLDKFWFYLTEEQHRRLLKYESFDLQEMLGLSDEVVQSHVDPYVHNYKLDNPFEESTIDGSMIRSWLNKAFDDDVESESSKVIDYRTVPDLTQFGSVFFSLAEYKGEFGAKLLDWFKVMLLNHPDPTDYLRCDDVRYWAAALQNFTYSKNSARRDAINAGNIVDLYSVDAAKEYIVKRATDFLLGKRMRAVEAVENARVSQTHDNVAFTFVQTEDLYTAIDCLVHTTWGEGTIAACYRLMWDTVRDGQHVPLLGDKYTMLTTGKYQINDLIVVFAQDNDKKRTVVIPYQENTRIVLCGEPEEMIPVIDYGAIEWTPSHSRDYWFQTAIANGGKLVDPLTPNGKCN